jgi:hypothetical protein
MDRLLCTRFISQVAINLRSWRFPYGRRRLVWQFSFWPLLDAQSFPANFLQVFHLFHWQFSEVGLVADALEDVDDAENSIVEHLSILISNVLVINSEHSLRDLHHLIIFRLAALVLVIFLFFTHFVLNIHALPRGLEILLCLFNGLKYFVKCSDLFLVVFVSLSLFEIFSIYSIYRAFNLGMIFHGLGSSSEVPPLTPLLKLYELLVFHVVLPLRLPFAQMWIVKHVEHLFAVWDVQTTFAQNEFFNLGRERQTFKPNFRISPINYVDPVLLSLKHVDLSWRMFF